MTDRTHPDSGRITGGIVEMLQARIAELEAQLASSGFTAADMATAAAQGFRDGVASLTTSAGSEPGASRAFLERALSAMEGVIDVADRNTTEFDALRSCVVDLTLMLFKPQACHPSPPEGMAGPEPVCVYAINVQGDPS